MDLFPLMKIPTTLYKQAHHFMIRTIVIDGFIYVFYFCIVNVSCGIHRSFFYIYTQLIEILPLGFFIADLLITLRRMKT
ncbi:hypothetical protein AC625_24835 [Peribacillus loiseleuriae]|uniref:Uncharacterized protein n=1 Tax=Peribacillus loiseleuriae TaxID=1679170 RepID=A0A0K9G3X6_9BACI|nr:hypothetical protein AC625_24835 [Peribacillus loiseleuriae]